MNLTKLLAILLFPLGLIVVLKATNIYTLNIGIDAALVGSAIMIIVQLFLLFMMHKDQGHKNISLMDIVSFVIFVSVAGYYIASTQAGFAMWTPLPLMLGTMMFLEGLYALH